MRDYDGNLFESSSPCSVCPPPKAARHGARASPKPPRRSSAGSSLRIAAPELFAELARRYDAVLDEAVEARIHEGESISQELGDLSARLGQLRASARDVIELHARVLDEKLASVPPRLTRAYVEEGRFVVLELMGRLLSDYRTAFLQATQSSCQGSSNLALFGAHQGNQE